MTVLAISVMIASPGAASAQSVDCDDISRAEAQQILGSDPSDPNNLDEDGDGRACERREGTAGEDREGTAGEDREGTAGEDREGTAGEKSGSAGDSASEPKSEGGGSGSDRTAVSEGSSKAGVGSDGSTPPTNSGQLASTGFDAWMLAAAGLMGIGAAASLKRRARTLS